jgi:hypothetical protein
VKLPTTILKLLSIEKQQRRVARSCPVEGLAYRTPGHDLGISVRRAQGRSKGGGQRFLVGGRRTSCKFGDVHGVVPNFLGRYLTRRNLTFLGVR